MDTERELTIIVKSRKIQYFGHMCISCFRKQVKWQIKPRWATDTRNIDVIFSPKDSAVTDFRRAD